MKKGELINHLETIANQEIPDSFCSFTEKELQEIVELANNIVTFQTAGLDKLFESMSLAMKYIPNFVLISLTKRFLEPPLAARITQKLTIKQATTVGNSLPADYLAKVTFYQEPGLSARLLGKLHRPHAFAVLAILCRHSPLKTLDLYRTLTTELQQFVKEVIDVRNIDANELRSETRRRAYQNLSSSSD